MTELTLSDGTRLTAAWCARDSDVLCAELNNARGLAEVAALLSDPARTRRIACDYHDSRRIYDGYTRLILVQDRAWQGGGVLIQLMKGE